MHLLYLRIVQLFEFVSCSLSKSQSYSLEMTSRDSTASRDSTHKTHRLLWLHTLKTQISYQRCLKGGNWYVTAFQSHVYNSRQILSIHQNVILKSVIIRRTSLWVSSSSVWFLYRYLQWVESQQYWGKVFHYVIVLYCTKYSKRGVWKMELCNTMMRN